MSTHQRGFPWPPYLKQQIPTITLTFPQPIFIFPYSLWSHRLYLHLFIYPAYCLSPPVDCKLHEGSDFCLVHCVPTVPRIVSWTEWDLREHMWNAWIHEYMNTWMDEWTGYRVISRAQPTGFHSLTQALLPAISGHETHIPDTVGCCSEHPFPPCAFVALNPLLGSPFAFFWPLPYLCD